MEILDEIGVEIRSWNKGVKYFITPCSGGTESGSLHQCQACGQECGDTACLYLHVQRHESGNPAVPTCLQKMGYTKIADFKLEFSKKVRRFKVRH